MRIFALVVLWLCASVMFSALTIPFFCAVSYLRRIADALEAQMRLHESWCEPQETPFS